MTTRIRGVVMRPVWRKRKSGWFDQVMLAVAGTMLAAGCSPGDSQPPSTSPRVVDESGDPVAGALVTVRDSAAGWAETVYTDRAGTFVPGARGARGEGRVVEVRSAGAEARPRSLIPVTDGPWDDLVLMGAPGGDAEPPASSFLAMLPDDERSRRFIVDCGGCHTFSSTIAFPEGEARSHASWADAITRMVQTTGPGTGFPIISSQASPDDAEWLTEVLSQAPASDVTAGPPVVHPGTRAVLTEFDIPEPLDLPHDVAVDGDGAVIVTGMFTHRMYVLAPGETGFTTVDIPTPNANPRAVDIDADGRWWVALGAPGSFAVHDPADASWSFHSIATYPHSIALDSMGGAWFNGHFTHRPEIIGRVDGTSGEVVRFEVPDEGDAESTIPYGLRVGPDGLVWGTQLRGNRIIRLDPASGRVDTWEMPTTASGPRRPDVAADGTVWIPAFGAGTLVRFEPETEIFTEIPFPVRGAGPYVARVDSDRGRVWIGTGHADVVASFDVEEEHFTVYPLPTRGALIRHLDIDPRTGDVWIAYGASPGIGGKIARLSMR